MGGGASDFLRRMNEQNDRIAAREAEKASPAGGVDPIREERMAERREKGQLRARPHPSKRPRKAKPVWDTVYLGVADGDEL